jgi:hypothetical protein
VTRRVRAALVCVAVGIVTLVAGWAVIGFADARSYPHLLSVLTQVEQRFSYSPLAFFRFSERTGSLVSLALVVLLAAAVAFASRGSDGDRRSFAVAIAGALIATPLLWLHYLALLYVPIALYRPRLSGVWLLPLVLWLTPASHANGSAWRIALTLAVVALVVARTVAESKTEWLVGWRLRLPRVAGRSPRGLVGTE